ncbi:integrase family protein [Desulfofarcimen acetoxidans DSM 771]|uniref:Integrase family protein n=1 Tax=Desulfofarcimen acetoxidans (strain ATCC 49208 / DSM 771 / KCTC 5769 / VKM B-1644 / 5575) TaxID=485916 RepID=C8W0H7_DESAS|nr:tyrosine-type recombinase/integrase [Desulfofarcimen acetoxidans]ACV63232.1 integrase family protein [Desulfofarcimen acetoxidans DSM 771]
MRIISGFRKRSIEVPDETGYKIDFDYAVELFKDAYMVDEWSQRTLNYHLENLTAFKKFLTTQAVNISLISAKTLDEYVKSMKNADKKKNTINGRVKTLRVFFRILNEKEYIPDNPALGLKTIRGPKPEIFPFSDEQINALLAQPDRTTFAGLRDYMIMQILLDTGVRLEELCNIKYSDVNLKTCRILVRKGKGNKSRTVLFGSETRRTIMKYLKVTGDLDAETNLILNQDGNPLKQRSVQDRISLHASAAGLKGVRPSPHTFRHTFAKKFLMNGGDPYVLRDLLGHNSMSTVIIYLRLFSDDLAKKYQGKSPVDSILRKKINQ